MAPLMVLFVSWALMRLLGVVGIGVFGSGRLDLTYALTVMFLFTASAHFTPMKEDLIRMVPARVPWPRQIVALTGVLEALGALGLLIPSLRLLAGVCLILLMLAMLPANISAARRNLTLRGRPAMSVWLRVPLQALFIGATAVAMLA
jgi:uncharacterized membrane protein